MEALPWIKMFQLTVDQPLTSLILKHYAPSDTAPDHIRPVVLNPGCTLESLKKVLLIVVPGPHP